MQKPGILGRIALKYALASGILDAIALSGAKRLFPSAAGRGVIFTLHHVRPEGPAAYDPNAHLSIGPEFLETAIMTSLEAGYVPVAVDELPRLLAAPDDKRRFVSFTLDDGYRNNAQYAAPVFRRHNVPYTIFVTAGFVERSHSLWWETAAALTSAESTIGFDFGRGAERLETRTPAQKRAAFERFSAFIATEDEDKAIARLNDCARAAGIDPLALTAQLTMDAGELRELAKDPLARFGAHTVSHVNLRRVGKRRLEQELALSAKAIENHIGCNPQAFAYPYGFAAAVGEREIQAAAEAGFSIAVTTQAGVLGPRLLDRPTAVNRVSLNGKFQRRRYVEALLSGLPFKLI